MTLFTTSRPTISVKSVTRYPTRITTGTGLSYSYDNGTLNISLDYSDIPDSAQIADPTNYTTVVYNKTTGNLEEVRLDYIPTTVVEDPVYTRGDSNFTIPNDYRVLSLVANLTASRTWTLPAAEDVTAGKGIFIFDNVGGISAVNTLVIAAPTGDTINGASSITLSNAYAGITIISNGGTQWTAVLTNVDSIGGLGTNVSAALKQTINAANGLVRLDSSGNVPALNGAALTSLNASNISSGTLASARLPGPTLSTIGGVKAKASETSKFVNQIDTDGSVNLAQPAFSDISGSVDASQLPNPNSTTLGGVKSKASESNKFLTAIGTDGAVSNAQPSFSNISGSVAASQLPNPSSTTLGGVQSKAAETNKFLTQIGTDGSVSSAQPAVSDISGFGTSVATALGVNVGSSGAFVTNGGALGTPASGNLSNCTFPTLNQNTTGTASNVTGTVAVANGGTGLTSLTAGYIPFGGSTTYSSDSSLFWDNTNKRLGIGTATPGQLLDIQSTGNVIAAITSTSATGGRSAVLRLNVANTGGDDPAGEIRFTYGGSYTQSGKIDCLLDGSANPGVMRFFTSTTERMRIDSAGNLGLGVTPSAWSTYKAIQIGAEGAGFYGNTSGGTFAGFISNGYWNGTSWIANNTGTAARYELSGNQHKWYYAGSTAFGAAISFTQAMTLDASGQLGIGITGPSAPLHVYNTANSGWGAIVEKSAGSGTPNGLMAVVAQNSSSNYIFAAAQGSYASPSYKLVVTGAGDVGIGTSSPGAKLDVQGGTIRFNATGAQSDFNVYGGQINTIDANWNYAGFNMVRRSSNTSSPRLIAMPLGGDNLASTSIGDYNAIWGIYNASPTSTSTSSALQGEMAYAAYYGHRWYINGGEKARLISNGQFLLGTTTSSVAGSGYNLIVKTIESPTGRGIAVTDTTNTSGYGLIFSSTSGYAGSITYSGTTITFNGTSDQKLKKNIVDAPSAMSVISGLSVRSFDWRATDEHQTYGLIAQEVLPVIPELVHVPDEDEIPMGIDYARFTPLLIKAIQELAAKVSALEAKQ